MNENIGQLPRTPPSRWRIPAGLTLLALLLRLPYFSLPVQGDEACTFTWFLSPSPHPIWYAATHYPTPNNHVLHTLACAVLYALTGCGFPWLRLPAFVAGVLCVPMTYVVFRRTIGGRNALLAAVLVACSAWMIRYSVNARGYSLAALLGLAAFGMAMRAIHTGRLRDTALTAVLCGLAIFTLPTMTLLGAAIGVVYLFQNPGRQDRSPNASRPVSDRRFVLQRSAFSNRPLGVGGSVWLHAIVFTLVTIGVCFVCYGPIISYMGIGALWSYRGVAPLQASELVGRFTSSLRDDFSVLSDGALPPALFGVAMLVGAIRLIRARRVRWAVVVPILILPFAAIVLRRLPPQRTVTYLIPYGAVLAAVGLSMIASWIVRWLRDLNGPLVRDSLLAPFSAGIPSGTNLRRYGLTVIVVLASIATLGSRGQFPLHGIEDVPDLQPIAAYLRSTTGDDTIIMARTGISESLQYHLHGIGDMDRIGAPRHIRDDQAAVLVRRRGASLGQTLTAALASWRVEERLYANMDYEVMRLTPANLQSAHADLPLY